MIYRALDGLDREASAIVMGSTGLGSSLSEGEAFDILDAYVELGGNFLDTARVYGDLANGRQGLAEQTIGRWLRARGNRARMIIGTKGAHPPLENMHASRLSAKDLREDLSRSLDALGVDCVEVYYLHRDDAARPVGEILETLNGFYERGQIKKLGASNWSAARIREANAYAAAHGMQGFSVNQPQWSLARQAIVEDDTLVMLGREDYNMHLESGMPCVPFSSQAKGFFIKLFEGGEAALSDKARRRFMTPSNMRIFQALTEIHARTGVSVGALSLAFLTGQSFPVFPIVGVSSLAQARALREAGDAVLDKEDMARLMRLSGLE